MVGVRTVVAMGAWLLLAPDARAQVPGHEPKLDAKCRPGFQWSRNTGGCEQAHCPPGAGRTHGLVCSCGEAWNKPFRTCRDDLLATHCVAKGQPCGPSPFDPLTGACARGFAADATGACVATFPAQLRCRVVTLDGAPVAGRRVDFGENKPKASELLHAQHATTDAAGEVAFQAHDRRAARVTLLSRGTPPRRLQIAVERQPATCVLREFDAASLARHAIDAYVAFLQSACVSADDASLLRATRFDPDADVSTPQYDAETKTVKLGGLDGDWDELARTLFHELGHALSDTVVDPTGYYVRGYPLVGKYVGGDHDNWVPAVQTNRFGPDVDVPQSAFEEAIADFIALLYFRSLGETYQTDLMTEARALEALRENGPGSGASTEGVISAFLYAYYRPLVESGEDGPARALGSFVRAWIRGRRTAWLGKPARTAQDLIAAIAASEHDDPTDRCTPRPGETGDLAALAKKFGLASAEPSLRIDPGAPGDDARAAVAAAAKALGLRGSAPLARGKRYALPAGAMRATLTVPRADFAKSGTVLRLSFQQDIAAEFELGPGGTPTVHAGTALASGGTVSTPHLHVVPEGTDVLITVSDARESIAVASGRAAIVERTGSKRRLELAAGEAVDYTPDAGFGSVRLAVELSRFEAALAGRDDHGELIAVAVGASIALGLGGLWLWSRRRNAARATHVAR